MVWFDEDEDEGRVSEADSSLHPKAGSKAVLERSPLRDNTALERRIGSSNSACYCSQAVSERPLALRTGLTTGVPTTRKLGTAFASCVPKPNSFCLSPVMTRASVLLDLLRGPGGPAQSCCAVTTAMVYAERGKITMEHTLPLVI